MNLVHGPLGSGRRALGAYVDTGTEPDTRPLLLFARASVLLMGAIQCWVYRHVNNPGGISYLDLADAYRRGDFQNAINGYWSPLYSLLLAPALAIVRPGAANEAAVVHLVNFVIYGAAVVAFDSFLRALIARSECDPERSIPRWAWIAFGYAIFAYSSLELIGVVDVSSDLLMSVFVYAAAAILMRLQRGPVTLVTGGAFGLWLGLGYLAKAAMFPLSVVFLGAALLSRGDWRRNRPAVAAAVLVFTIVVSPFVVALSVQKGRLTTGDVGKLVYAWFVNDVTKYAHWQGEAPGRGVPVHPDRSIHERPAVFEYATPVSGTHPVWYDPSYWYEGLETHVSAKQQLRALRAAAVVYAQLATRIMPELLVIAILLTWSSARDAGRRIGRHAYLLIPALLPFAMFAILHTEDRFIGAFLVLALMALLLAVRLPGVAESRKLVAVLMVSLSVIVAGRAAASTAAAVVARQFGSSNPDYDVAQALQRMGLRPGDRIGMIGWAYDAYWARLARVRFVAELPQPGVADFWSEAPETRRSVYDAFRRAGARCLVTESLPHSPAAEGWRPIGTTGLFIYFL